MRYGTVLLGLPESTTPQEKNWMNAEMIETCEKHFL